MLLSLGSEDLYMQVYADKDAEAAAGPEVAEIFAAADQARQMAEGSNVQDWNQATNMVITDAAGGQIMGDWAQGEFQVAGEVAGEDYTCLPGLGVNEVLSTAGDAFYFPMLDDEELSAAQAELASVMFSPETQVAFNLKKGSLPIRLDVDLNAANDCMKKGIEILKAGNTVPATTQLNSEDTNTQINDLFVEFFSDDSITPEDAQARFVEIIKNAD
jgi:glucose/mannose transport system substrate-binding protein